MLFPMVMDCESLGAAVERLRSHEGNVGESRVEVGAMIETPAAVLMVDEIARQVDFLSIGTNDLAHFVLAADRDAVDLLDGSGIHHPSVLRAIARVVAAARAAGCPVSVCGEAAGDPRDACLLAGLGIRELSMSPARAPRVRQALRSITADDAKTIAADALAASGPSAVVECLAEIQLPSPDGGTITADELSISVR